MGNESEITQALRKELKKLFDDREFIEAILLYLPHDDDRKAILDFIYAGEDVSVETVTVMALDINDMRKTWPQRLWQRITELFR